MTFADTQLHGVLTGTRTPTRQFDGPQEARIVAADGHSATFVIPGFSQTAQFGPAPYPRPSVLPTALTVSTLDGATVSPDPHTHAPAVPPAGTRCLAAFAGPDAGGDYQPWIVAFAGWPA